MIFLISNQDVVKHIMIRFFSYNRKDSGFFGVEVGVPGEKFSGSGSGTGLTERENRVSGRVSGRKNVPPLVPTIYTIHIYK